MELSGTIIDNLRYAVKSAERRRGQSVYPETVQFWRDLIQLARSKRIHDDETGWMVEESIGKLEAAIADLTSVR